MAGGVLQKARADCRFSSRRRSTPRLLRKAANAALHPRKDMIEFYAEAFHGSETGDKVV
jgi:hypothetical protein